MDTRQAPKRSIPLLAAIFMASMVSLLGAAMVIGAAPYLVSVAAQQRYIDIWTVLSVVVVASALGGVTGAWLCIRRNKPFLAMALLLLPFTATHVLEANRCDVYPMCEATDWARLPRAAFEWSLPRQEKPRFSKTTPPDIKVLDGDTLLFNGKVVRIAGIDTPELGQTAKCWAEAALGGEARNALESALFDPSESEARAWELAEVSPPDREGRISANLITKDGDDIRDHMVVYGYAARTEGRWNWCGADRNLHSPRSDESPPHGPNMWWPADHIYDPRAAD